MLPMECPSCRSSNHRSAVTNGKLPDQIVRRRACRDCGFKWYTVEIRVPDYAVGWSAALQSKPVLRVPIETTLWHLEEADVEQVAVTNGRARGVKKCERPAA